MCVATGLLLCVNGSVKNGGFEQQNKLMEPRARDTGSSDGEHSLSFSLTHTHMEAAFENC